MGARIMKVAEAEAWKLPPPPGRISDEGPATGFRLRTPRHGKDRPKLIQFIVLRGSPLHPMRCF